MEQNQIYGGSSLTRVNAIINDPEYLNYVHDLEELEKKRVFCRHNMEHFLNVARIAMILNMEENADHDRELIYATALLHDIGRANEYRTGVRHEQESVRLAPPIIRRAGFNEDEEAVILSAIGNHRNKDCISADAKSLDSIIYRADKLSRACFYCDAQENCDKARKKRNHELRI